MDSGTVGIAGVFALVAAGVFLVRYRQSRDSTDWTAALFLGLGGAVMVIIGIVR